MTRSAIDHPANAALRRYFEPRLRGSTPVVAIPDDVDNPYYSLGTHPDIVARLWDELGEGLPADCRTIFCGVPTLMHPVTKVVFAFAWGTMVIAARLPERERTAARNAGATRVHIYSGGALPFSLDDIGDEWLFFQWLRDEPEWILAAYEFAGMLSS